MNTSKQALGLGALLFVLTLVAYAPSLHNGYIWDDDEWITQNTAVTGPDGLRQIWLEPGKVVQYYPILFSFFRAQYHVWGAQPIGYHLISVLLHSGNAVLVWLILRRLKVPGGLLAAAIFALHPVQVESVAWATEQKNLLSALFFLGAVLAACRFWFPRTPGTQPSWMWYALVLLLFTAALLSKTAVCMFPVVLLFILWWKNDRLTRRDFLLVLSLLIVAGGLGIVTVWVEQTRCGAVGAQFGFTIGQRTVIAGQAIWFYLYTLLWPVNLTPIYPRWNISAISWWQYLFPISVLTVVLLLWLMRTRVGRGPLAATMFFILVLFPALGFSNIGYMNHSFVADHFQYLACLGPIILVAAGVVRITQRFAGFGRLIGFTAGVVAVGLLGILTFHQQKVYRNIETFCWFILDKNPKAWVAYSNLDKYYTDRNLEKEAIRRFEDHLTRHPTSVDALNHLGTLYNKDGQQDKALDIYTQALRINPDYGTTHNNLANLLFEKGQYAAAIDHYRKVLSVRPYSGEAHYNLGMAFLSMDGRLDEAVREFKEASTLSPDDTDIRQALNEALSLQRQLALDMEIYQARLKAAPQDPAVHLRLGQILERQGKPAEAISHYRQAMKYNPQGSESMVRLVWLLATSSDDKLRNGSEALRLARRAKELSASPSPELLDALAAAYAETGDFAQAQAVARQAVEQAQADGKNDLVRQIETRRSAYEARRTWRQ